VSPFGVCGECGDAALLDHAEADVEIGWRKIWGGLVGPFDQANAVSGEILVKPRIEILFCLIESIEIKVIEVYSRNWMNFNQCVGRAFHRAGLAGCPQQSAHQGRFAGAEIAFEPDNAAGRHDLRKPATEFQRGGFIGEGYSKMACMHELKEKIRGWARELGFHAVGFADAGKLAAEAGLNAWLAAGCHGTMDYMAAHGSKRSHPAELEPGTRSVIVARMNYRPASADFTGALAAPERAAISSYALGRDYHKLLRARLQQLADRITAEAGEHAYRVFTDSAPVMEVELARQSGLGWRGKHTLLLDRDAGSYFFLGELFTSLSLPADSPVTDHCGSCTACLDACPTQAFDGPYRLDARRCISYLTIELKESVPEHLRDRLGNRIYGCDDCQLACPWNRFSPATAEADFQPRQGLDSAQLLELFAWTEEEFNQRLQGSPIRRIGHERWLRNIAVALGNAPRSEVVVAALVAAAKHPSPMVREHVAWALERQRQVGPVATGREGSAHHSLQDPG
jgi:epoxyqueuosine reductase